MLNIFFPDAAVRRAWDVPYADFYEKGYRAILFDIDNTLVYPDAPADEPCKKFINELKNLGYQIAVISNNKGPRVESFAADCGIDYVAKAGKPLRSGYERGMERFHATPQTTLFVGDQLFTDVWGAGRLGIYSILVEPMTLKEEPQIVLKRLLEKPVLYAYRKKTTGKKEELQVKKENHG
ncbi:MAG: YqeG family HAD IIIA-type phosphatase [Lachnospiraceae bacterium]|nr:YqeG family HAD IIIA-type phosphatase [Lachnospiraceae bacterium]